MNNTTKKWEKDETGGGGKERAIKRGESDDKRHPRARTD